MATVSYGPGVSIDATREELPRLATLPFDPTYKLMATFNQAKDASGNDVVRCFVKGAAPAVMARAATALANGFTPNSVVDGGPVCIGNWCPHNYAGGFSGPSATPLARACSSSTSTTSRT